MHWLNISASCSNQRFDWCSSWGDTGDFLTTSLPGQCKQTTGHRNWKAQLKVKPNFSLAVPPSWTLQRALCTSSVPSVQCEKQRRQDGSYIHIVQGSSLTLSLTGCIFKQLLLLKWSFKPVFFFPQRSRLAQINTNYPSKLSIWMAFRFYSLFQWGTNISSPVS